MNMKYYIGATLLCVGILASNSAPCFGMCRPLGVSGTLSGAEKSCTCTKSDGSTKNFGCTVSATGCNQNEEKGAPCR